MWYWQRQINFKFFSVFVNKNYNDRKWLGMLFAIKTVYKSDRI